MALPSLPRPHRVVKNKHYPGGKITIQPYTVAEESILLQARDGEPLEKLIAIRQLVEACTVGGTGKQLPIYVIEDVFLRLHEISIGEIIELQTRCDGEITTTEKDEEGNIVSHKTEKCNQQFPVHIDVRKIVIREEEGHKLVIPLTETIGVKMRYPTLDDYIEMGDDSQKAEETIIRCIESIYDGDKVYPAEDSTKEELMEFYKQMSPKNKLDVLNDFFQKIPKIHYEASYTCPKCGKEHHLKLSNLTDFFT